MSARRGALPPVEEVVAGCWSVPLPIPDSPLRYILAYALETGPGLVLIDSGWNAPEVWDALADGLGRIGAAVADIRGVLLTHLHADHYGLAGRIREESGAWTALHPADARLIRDRYEDVDDLLARSHRWLRDDLGVPDDAISPLRDASLGILPFVESVQPDVLLEDGDRPDVPGWDLVAVHTPGHTPGHLCFTAETAGLVFTGDHVLPRITPHVGKGPQSDADPLGDFLASLDRVRGRGDGLVMPGHEYRFRGIDDRLDELVAHHGARLDEIEASVGDGASTVWEIASHVSWSRGWDSLAGFMRRLALSEVNAHVARLERAGRLERLPGTPARWTVA